MLHSCVVWTKESFNLPKMSSKHSYCYERSRDRCDISCIRRLSASELRIPARSAVTVRVRNAVVDRSRESILRVYRAVSCGQQGRGSSLDRPASWEQT